MQMNFFRIQEKYKLRHAALGLLYNKLEGDPLHKTNLEKSKTLVSELALSLKISEREFKRIHFAFHSFQDDHVQCFGNKDAYEIGITEAGIIAYLDDYWIREGQKELNDRIYNITRWFLPIIAILISVAALIFSQSKSTISQHQQSTRTK